MFHPGISIVLCVEHTLERVKSEKEFEVLLFLRKVNGSSSNLVFGLFISQMHMFGEDSPEWKPARITNKDRLSPLSLIRPVCGWKNTLVLCKSFISLN